VRSLWPREHGAYGQLGFPLATGLSVTWPNAAALLVAGASLLLFFAHEPALVGFGRRGQRAREEDGRRAVRLCAGMCALAGIFGATGLWLGPRPARAGALIAAALGAALTGAIALRKEKTVGGELIAAAAMTSAGFVTALAAGAPWSLAATIWSAWLLAFAAAIFPVRATVVSAGLLARLLPTLAAIAAATFILPRRFAAAAAPLFAVSLLLAVRPPPMKQMTRAGWMLMIAGAATAALLVAGVHR
jgi:hypothetical protein